MWGPTCCIAGPAVQPMQFLNSGRSTLSAHFPYRTLVLPFVWVNRAKVVNAPHALLAAAEEAAKAPRAPLALPRQ